MRRPTVRELARGQIQKGPWRLPSLSDWLYKDQASARNQEPLWKGKHSLHPGIRACFSSCVSSRADSGLCPQADLGVAFFVTDFPSSLSQLLLLLWQRCECLSGVGHAPRLVISAPFLSVVSVGWRVLSSWGGEDGNATEYQLTFFPSHQDVTNKH